MATIPITSLSPQNSPPVNHSIRAIVTLSWPYSSSTRQCALLLADPDFRLRNQKGQVRVRFTGASAEAVARSRIGIGDEVILALDGALWERDPEAARTPGKSVDGELLFKRRLRLSIVRDGGNLEVDVDAPVSPPHLSEKDFEVATPLPKVTSGLRSSLASTSELVPSYTYTSPAFLKRSRLSGHTAMESSYDPFSADTLDAGSSRKNTWSAFGSSIRWHYSGKTPSPEKDHSEQDVVEMEQEEPPLDASRTLPHTALQPEESPTRMPPPPVPWLDTSSKRLSTEPTADTESNLEQEGPSTPQLRPVRSPTLPLPSPFPVDALPRQLGDIGMRVPVDDLSAQQDVATEILGQIESEGFDELNGNVPMQDLIPVQDTSITSMDDRPVSTDIPKQEEHNELDHPRTPPRTVITAGSGLDSIASTPASLHVTPQSEKEKAMAPVYRSLFGFKETHEAISPSPHVERPQSPTPVEMPPDVDRVSLEAEGNVQQSGQQAVPGSPGTTVEEQPLEHVIAQDLPQSSIQPSPIEVIDLDSSSDEEDEKQPQPAQPIGFPLPAWRPPGFEVQSSMLESQAEDLLRPEASLGEVSSELQPEIQVNLQTVDPLSQEESILPKGQTEDTAQMRHVAETPLYPSLPLSPTYSQLIPEMISQPTDEAITLDTDTSGVLPTPQLTQDESFTEIQEPARDQAFAAHLETEVPVTQQSEDTEEPMSPQRKKASKKRSQIGRISNVPDVISDWFSPQSTKGIASEADGQISSQLKESQAETKEMKRDTRGLFHHTLQEFHGLSTAHAYFTPLSKLGELLNPPSQQAHDSKNTIDVLAIVADHTNEPIRAKAGPRDYFTIFKIFDASLPAQTSVLVEVYRPWKATLPVASVGDIALLRAFVIKSRKRQPYLLSTDASSWCVWRYGDESTVVEKDNEKPIWARKQGNQSQTAREEIKGPPVELGEEEREHAVRLRAWWRSLKDDKDAYDEPNEAVVASQTTQTVAAEL